MTEDELQTRVINNIRAIRKERSDDNGNDSSKY